MHQPLSPAIERIGDFQRIVAWLQHRNRLHAPRPLTQPPGLAASQQTWGLRIAKGATLAAPPFVSSRTRCGAQPAAAHASCSAGAAYGGTVPGAAVDGPNRRDPAGLVSGVCGGGGGCTPGADMLSGASSGTVDARLDAAVGSLLSDQSHRQHYLHHRHHDDPLHGSFPAPQAPPAAQPPPPLSPAAATALAPHRPSAEWPWKAPVASSVRAGAGTGTGTGPLPQPASAAVGAGAAARPLPQRGASVAWARHTTAAGGGAAETPAPPVASGAAAEADVAGTAAAAVAAATAADGGGGELLWGGRARPPPHSGRVSRTASFASLAREHRAVSTMGSADFLEEQAHPQRHRPSPYIAALPPPVRPQSRAGGKAFASPVASPPLSPPPVARSDQPAAQAAPATSPAATARRPSATPPCPAGAASPTTSSTAAAASAAASAAVTSLSAAIHGADTLDDLAALYNRFRRVFRRSAVHVSAALSRLPRAAELAHTGAPRLAAPAQEALLAALLEDFEAHRAAGAYGPRELSACAWALGKLGRTERWALVEELAKEVLAARRRQRQQQARLRKASTTAFLAARRAERATQSDVGNAPPGMAEEAAAAAAAAATSEPLLPACRALDLSNMALGMAKTGCVVPRRWRQLSAAAAEQLGEFGAQELVNFAWSLAQAHRRYCRSRGSDGGGGDEHGGEAAQDGTGASHTGGAGGGASPVPLAADVPGAGEGTVGAPGASRGSVTSSPTAVPSAAAPVRALLHRDWQSWLGPFVEDSLAPRLRALLRRCSGQQVANAAWALAALGHAGGDTMAAVAAEAEARAGGLAPRAVCQLTWALATMVRTANACACACGGDGGNDTGGNTGSASSSAGGGAVQPPAAASGPAAPGVAVVAVRPEALRALAKAAHRRIRRFSGQGLSNVLWGLRSLGLRVRRRLLAAAAREAVLRIEEMRPLGLATLVADWAAAGLYHPGLFAAASAAATAQLPAFRPGTLCRLLTAHGAVGHADRRLFTAAAAALLAPPAAQQQLSVGAAAAAAVSGGGASGTIGGAAALGRRPLDELSPMELYGLAVAYGQAGVHVPYLMDEILLRLAPSLTVAADGGALPARAACRLACSLAAQGHIPAAQLPTPPARGPPGTSDAAATSPNAPGDAAAAAAAGAAAAVHALRRPLLSGLSPSADPPLAVAGVWALMRLDAAGAPAALRLAEALCRRFAPAARSLAEGLPAVLRSPAMSGDPRVVARLLWVVGRGAAAALAEAEARARGSAIATATARESAAVGPTAEAVAAAAAAGAALGQGFIATADMLLEEQAEELHGEELAALAEGLAALLATSLCGGRALGGAGGAGVGSPGAELALALQRPAYELFLRTAELALLRRPGATATTAVVAKPAGSPPARPPPGLAPRHLLTVVQAMYDSGVAAQQPLMRAAAARQVVHALAAATASGSPDPLSRAAGVWQAPTHGGDAGQVQAPPPRPAAQQTRSGTSPRCGRRPARVPASRPSEDDVARLLAAAAPLGLYDQPAALPVLRAAARWLAWRLSGVGAAPAPAPALAAAAEGVPPLGLRALRELLCCCRPAALDAAASEGTSTSGGGSSGPRGDGVRPPPPSGGGGDALRASLYRWAVRQSMPVLPWLPVALREQVVADSEALGLAPAPPAVAVAAPAATAAAVPAATPAADAGAGGLPGKRQRQNGPQVSLTATAPDEPHEPALTVSGGAAGLAQESQAPPHFPPGSVRRVRVEQPQGEAQVPRLSAAEAAQLPPLWVQDVRSRRAGVGAKPRRAVAAGGAV